MKYDITVSERAYYWLEIEAETQEEAEEEALRKVNKGEVNPDHYEDRRVDDVEEVKE